MDPMQKVMTCQVKEAPRAAGRMASKAPKPKQATTKPGVSNSARRRSNPAISQK